MSRFTAANFRKVQASRFNAVKMVLQLAVGLLLITAFAEAQQLSCSATTSCKKDTTAEDESITFSCTMTNIGVSRPVLTWHNKQNGQEIQGLPSQTRQGNYSVIRNFTWKVVAPKVVPVVCKAAVPNAEDVTCETEECDILYSVRNVVTWPLLLASPGETITCVAAGNPDPEFSWQWKEVDGDSEWEDVPDETDKKIEAPMNNGTSYQLRCVAKNEVNGKKHEKESIAVTVSKDGAAIRTKIIIGVVVGVVILAIIGGLVYFFVLK